MPRAQHAPTRSRTSSHSRKPKRGAAHAEEAGEASSGRSIWTGSISFGLVQIPVRLMPAESHAEDISFHQLDRRDMSRIRYERVNESTGEKVEWSDIVKGYELDDGRWVTIEDDELEKAHVEATHTIDIQDFVARDQIPPTYFEKPYFIVPDGRSPKAYAVLREVLAKKNLVAVSLVVIRTKQRLCAVMAEEKGLVLEILRFADELKPVSAVSHLPPRIAASEKERELAERLVESLEGDWDPSKYKDTFKSEIMKSIETKAKTGKLPASRAARAPVSGVTDLVALLRESVANTAKKQAAKEDESPSKARKERAAARKTRKKAA